MVSSSTVICHSLLQMVGIRGEYWRGSDLMKPPGGQTTVLQKIDRGARKVTPAPTNNSTRSACLLLRGARPPSPRLLLLPRLARRVVIVDRCATLERLLGGRQRRACARPAALGVHCAGCATPWGPPSVQVEHSTLMVLQRRWEGKRGEARGARCPGEGPSGALSSLIEATRGVPPQRRCGTLACWVMMDGGKGGTGTQGRGTQRKGEKAICLRCTRAGCMACVPVARHSEV